MDEVNVEVEVEINPTENEEKVKRAVENMFTEMKLEVKPQKQGGGLLIGKGEGIDVLTKLYNLLRRERIRDAARGVLYGGIDGKSISFFLNKQAAYVGHVSFSKPVGESPLGSIKVEIHCDNPREFIDWIAPRTV